jgi:hypothetical protein
VPADNNFHLMFTATTGAAWNSPVVGGSQEPFATTIPSGKLTAQMGWTLTSFFIEVAGNFSKVVPDATTTPPVIPGKRPCDTTGGMGAQAGQAPGNPSTPSQDSSNPIRYATGEIRLAHTDILSGGFTGCGVSRSYSNLQVNTNPVFGPGWFVDELPSIAQYALHYTQELTNLEVQEGYRSNDMAQVLHATPYRFWSRLAI